MHISFVRSVTLDDWSINAACRMAVGGNKRAKENLPKTGLDFLSKYSSAEAANYKLLLDRVEKEFSQGNVPKFVPGNDGSVIPDKTHEVSPRTHNVEKPFSAGFSYKSPDYTGMGTGRPSGDDSSSMKKTISNGARQIWSAVKTECSMEKIRNIMSNF